MKVYFMKFQNSGNKKSYIGFWRKEIEIEKDQKLEQYQIFNINVEGFKDN